MTLDLEKRLEALLFWKAEPQSIGQLTKTLATSEETVRLGLKNLEGQLADRGLRLLEKNGEFTLGTAPELGELLEQVAKEELSADLGRAGLETLTIVSYRGPVTRAEIDYIRGVNSSFTLRHLLRRSLVEKIPNPNDGRVFLYQPTFELMSLLGLVRLNELPEYEEIKNRLDNFLTIDETPNN